MPRPTRIAVHLTLALLATALGLGCARGPHGFQPVSFGPTPRPEGADGFPNWPVQPREAEAIMTGPPAEMRVVEHTEHGVGGAERARLWFQDIDQEVQFKIKRVPDDLDGMNNAPRKEIAAYQIQKLFLDPEDYVVPTTLARCVPLEVWLRFHAADAPQLTDANCVLVTASLWLDDVTIPDVLYDKKRFLSDPIYARYMADFNVFSYLIQHRDTRAGNALISQETDRRHVFAIDNGISFGTFPYNFFVANWDHLRVAALREETIRRLRGLRYMDLNQLQVAQQLANDGTGHYLDTSPGLPLDSERGAEFRDGVLQFGLTDDEIAGVWKRLQKLLERVDRGEIPLF